MISCEIGSFASGQFRPSKSRLFRLATRADPGTLHLGGGLALGLVGATHEPIRGHTLPAALDDRRVEGFWPVAPLLRSSSSVASTLTSSSAAFQFFFLTAWTLTFLDFQVLEDARRGDSRESACGSRSTGPRGSSADSGQNGTAGEPGAIRYECIGSN
jgi:hypothetical protein